MFADSSDITAALRPFRAELDERGLLPLESARAALKAALGTPRDSEEADRIWASVLSLADVPELIEATAQLSWTGLVRGNPNFALLDRYGDALLDWIRTRVDDGVLSGDPACVADCLLEMSEPAVLDFLLGLQGYAGDSPRPPEKQRNTLLRRWVSAHPRVSTLPIFERAKIEEGEGGLYAWLLGILADAAPGSTFARIAREAGEVEAERVFARFQLPRKLAVEKILAALDRAVDNAAFWPRFSFGDDDRGEYFGLRLLVVREQGGDAWAIVLERLQGAAPESLCVERRQLSGFGGHVEQVNVPLDILDDAGGRVRVVGPAGELALSTEQLEHSSLQPDLSSEPNTVWRLRRNAIRAYLERHPGALWPPVSEVLSDALPFPAEALVITTDFEHVVGGALPSESKCYRSAVEALVRDDATLFEPGEPNTHWSRHARYRSQLSQNC